MKVVDYAFGSTARNEFDILAAEGTAIARHEVPERHLEVPPTLASRCCTVQMKPFGRSHFAGASASRNAR
jgi:hypothetical protein